MRKWVFWPPFEDCLICKMGFLTPSKRPIWMGFGRKMGFLTPSKRPIWMGFGRKVGSKNPFLNGKIYNSSHWNGFSKKVKNWSKKGQKWPFFDHLFCPQNIGNPYLNWWSFLTRFWVTKSTMTFILNIWKTLSWVVIHKSCF